MYGIEGVNKNVFFSFFHESFIHLMCGEGVYMVVVDV